MELLNFLTFETYFSQEMISCLEDGMKTLLETFRRRNNNNMPVHIIVYRDGVSDGQFDHVTNIEVPAIKGALALLGYNDDKVRQDFDILWQSDLL